MEIRNRRSNRRCTAYIELDTHKCKACWKCVEACREKAIGKVNIFFHKHAKIVNSANCKGCLKCVQKCVYNAITKKLTIEN